MWTPGNDWAPHEAHDEGAAEVWTPADIEGANVWLRADLGVTEEGGAVATWADQSGNGYHLTQATADARPTRQTGGPGGHPFLRFDGVDDYLRNATGLGAQPTRVFIVCVMSRAAPGTARTVADGGATNTRRIFNPNAATVVSMYAGASLQRTGTASGATWQIIEALFNGASSKLRTHGTAYATGDAGAGADSGLVVGAVGGLDSFADCDVAELVIGDWSDEDADVLMAYAVERYTLA